MICSKYVKHLKSGPMLYHVPSAVGLIWSNCLYINDCFLEIRKGSLIIL